MLGEKTFPMTTVTLEELCATRKAGWRFSPLCTSGLFLPCCWEDAQPSTGSTRAKFWGKQQVWQAGARREQHPPALLHCRVSQAEPSTGTNRSLSSTSSPPHLHPTPSPHPPHSESGQTQRFSRGQEKHIFGNSKATFSSNTPATKKISFRQILYL